MPMQNIGWALHYIAFFDSLPWLPFYLVITHTICYNQYLSRRMGMPIASRSRFKIHIANNGVVYAVICNQAGIPGFTHKVFSRTWFAFGKDAFHFVFICIHICLLFTGH